MMTLDEIQNLQIGDQVQLPSGVVATVQTVNQSNKLVALSMPGNSTVPSNPVFGEVPPDRIDAETTIICPWVDLTTSTKVANE